MPSVPWKDIRANRVLVAHIYHRIDYEILWETLTRDMQLLAAEVGRWHSAQTQRSADESPEPGA